MFNSILKEIINKYESVLEENNVKKDKNLKFSKYDYFLSCDTLDGAISYLGLSQTGYTLKCLNDRKIFPLYGVFNPSRQDYLELFSNYMVKLMGSQPNLIKSAMDLGCGSGVLSFIMAQNGINKILAIDKEDNAVETCKMNAQALGYNSVISSIKYDINGFNLKQQQLNSVELAERFDKYDLIVCNPPWINSTYILTQNSFENSIYDANHEFLISALKFSSKFLLF